MAPPEEYVVAMPFKVETGDVQRGDRYQRAAWRITDETDATLKYSRFIVPLTHESYAIAIASRAAGTVGTGYTIDELLAWGIIDDVRAEDLHIAQAADDVVNGYHIRKVRKGPFTLLDVLTARGERTRDASFKTREAAVAFIDTLPPVGQDGAAQEESGDDVHIQSGALEPA